MELKYNINYFIFGPAQPDMTFVDNLMGLEEAQTRGPINKILEQSPRLLPFSPLLPPKHVASTYAAPTFNPTAEIIASA